MIKEACVETFEEAKIAAELEAERC